MCTTGGRFHAVAAGDGGVSPCSFREPARGGGDRHDQPQTGVDGRLTFVGTATTILELGSFTLLTDPTLLHRGQRAYLGKGLWSRRLTEPALDVEDLPSLDAVVLSHLHGDHFDRVARRGLARDAPRAHDATRRATPASLGLRDGTDGRLTGSHVDEVRRRFPDIDTSVVHLGGSRVLFHTVTMDADQGVDFLERVQPRQAVPVHHSDYGVFTSPLAEFVVKAGRAGHRDVRVVEPGERVDLRARSAQPGR